MRTGKAAKRAATRPRKYWHETDAQRVVDALEASGLSVAEFCREHDLHDKRVRRWRKALQERAAAPVEMLPVKLVDRGATGAVGAEVQVLLRNGRRLVVRGAVDGALLTEVAQVVEGWGC